MGRGEKGVFLSPSINHQALQLPSPPFSFSLKGEFGSWGVSLSPNINFNSILRKFVPTSFLRRKRMINLSS